jgi:hypothetical protein
MEIDIEYVKRLFIGALNGESELWEKRIRNAKDWHELQMVIHGAKYHWHYISCGEDNPNTNDAAYQLADLVLYFCAEIALGTK